VREALRDMPEIADNGVELDALAALPTEQQAAAVAAVKSGGAPNVRVAIATTAQPTLCAADNADRLLDAMLEQIRRLGKEDRQRLWDALADRWHEEIGRAFTCRLAQRPRPAADEIAEPLAASPPLIAEGDNKTDETRRREALSACATPSHPDARGGLVQPINGPFCERVYAIGSVEWAEQQRRGQMAFDGGKLSRDAKTPRVQTLRGMAGRSAEFQSLGETPLQICCRCTSK
jgi:hypothetical protein